MACVLGFTVNLPEFFWGVRRGLSGPAPMPASVHAKAAACNRYDLLLIDALILGSVAALARKNSILPAQIGLNLHSWGGNVAIGVTAGLLVLGVQAWIVKGAGLGPSDAFVRFVRGGSVAFWIAIFIPGAFSEELWIAFCIVAFDISGYSTGAAVVLTAIAFGAAHFSYRPGGAAAVALKGAVSASLFLWCGSLIPMFLFHLMNNLGSLYQVRAGGSASEPAS